MKYRIMLLRNTVEMAGGDINSILVSAKYSQKQINQDIISQNSIKLM